MSWNRRPFSWKASDEVSRQVAWHGGFCEAARSSRRRPSERLRRPNSHRASVNVPRSLCLTWPAPASRLSLHRKHMLLESRCRPLNVHHLSGSYYTTRATGQE